MRALLPALLLAAVPAAAEIPLRDFARLDEFTEVKISPGGEFLAVAAPIDKQTSLAVIRLSDRKLTGALKFRDGQHVVDFWWVGPERVVVSIADKDGTLEQPQATGELFGMDADGGRKTYLFGYRGDQSVGSHLKNKEIARGSARMVDPLPGDPNHALIAVDWWNARDAGTTQLFRLNVVTGQRAEAGRAPLAGFAEFITDAQGRPCFASVRDTAGALQAYSRSGETQDWRQENVGALAQADMRPLFCSEDGKAAHMISAEDGDASCLVRQEFGGGRTAQACGLNRVLPAFDRRAPMAAVFEPGAPEFRLLDGADADGALYAALAQKFGGDFVEPVSATQDGSKVVLFVYSDRNPGDWYLFDRSRKKAEHLLSRRAWIDPATMAERRPIQYTTRDRHAIWGYLTLPPARKPEKLPLVVLPHGGPFFARDRWRWDADAQMLASRGYAVLQANFRGSGGYGRAHQESARHGWGTVMIDDLADGARWAAAQGYADAGRICIFGGSYGGYAALMSAVREPGLYRCAIGYAGVYDLEMLESEIPPSHPGAAAFRNYVGDTAALLRAQSPLTHLERLKSAVLIAHGEEDRRVPFSQAKALRKALEKREYPYEWLAKPREGHGFYREENRVELYERLLAFLDRHIGAPVEAAAVEKN